MDPDTGDCEFTDTPCPLKCQQKVLFQQEQEGRFEEKQAEFQAKLQEQEGRFEKRFEEKQAEFQAKLQEQEGRFEESSRQSCRNRRGGLRRNRHAEFQARLQELVFWHR